MYYAGSTVFSLKIKNKVKEYLLEFVNIKHPFSGKIKILSTWDDIHYYFQLINKLGEPYCLDIYNYPIPVYKKYDEPNKPNEGCIIIALPWSGCLAEICPNRKR